MGRESQHAGRMPGNLPTQRWSYAMSKVAWGLPKCVGEREIRAIEGSYPVLRISRYPLALQQERTN